MTTPPPADGAGAAADPSPAQPIATDPPGAALGLVGPSPTEADSSPIGAALGRVGPPSGGGDGLPGGQAPPSGIEALGVGGPFDGFFRVYPVLITTGGTAVVWAAFVFFGKRRRDGEPPAPDAVLAAHAATAIEPIPAVDLVPPAPPTQLPPGVQPDEALMPRWRRPSLLHARKTDPLRTASVAVSLSFDGVAAGSLGLVDDGERRRIRYRLVRLLDLPDEAAGRELGVLDAGDEVQIVDEYGIYRLVVCPDGQRGWLHKMVLGDLVDGDRTAEPAPDGIDEDVLAAFLAARRQTA